MDLYNRLIVSFIILLANKEVLADDDDGLCYYAGFSSNVIVNTDFANINFGLSPGPDGDDSKAGMIGNMTLNKDVPSDAKLDLNIVKKTENGEEPAMSLLTILCESLEDNTAPSYNMTQSLGMLECPVVAGFYELPEIFYIDISFANEVLNHEYVGYYLALLHVVDKQKQVLMTIPMEMSITEGDC